jgi:hypothetical protein
VAAPACAEAWLFHAITLDATRVAEIVLRLDCALALDSSLTRAWSFRAAALQRILNFEEALRSYEEAGRLCKDAAERAEPLSHAQELRSYCVDASEPALRQRWGRPCAITPDGCGAGRPVRPPIAE